MAKRTAEILEFSPRSLPRYSVPQAARYLGLPDATLRSWVSGRWYTTSAGRRQSDALIRRPNGHSRLSFFNLVEAYVLTALRRQHGVKMSTLRAALQYAENECGESRLLLSPDLRVLHENVFFRHFEELLDLGASGQRAMEEVLGRYLRRIEWDRDGPFSLFPITRPGAIEQVPTLVRIRPDVAFGRPVTGRYAIQTETIADRFCRGESVKEIADDYELGVEEVEEAIRYEQPFHRAA